MKEFARSLLDHLLATYGDIGFVTPAAFANALRTIAELPADATPLHLEQFFRTVSDVRVNAAPTEVVGVNYREGDRAVIETGRGRSIAERNITIPHEFGEVLRCEINALLRERGLPTIEWPDRAWDEMAVELISPVAAFRHAAQANGLDIMDLSGPLSFEATVIQLKASFEDSIPLFSVYYRNGARWERGRGFESDSWEVGQSAWTKAWFGHGYERGREVLVLPRRKMPLSAGSVVDRVRRTGRALLFHAQQRTWERLIEVDVLIRARSYGRDVAQVFVVGVAKPHAPILRPQIDIVGPDECTGPFSDLFGDQHG